MNRSEFGMWAGVFGCVFILGCGGHQYFSEKTFMEEQGKIVKKEAVAYDVTSPLGMSCLSLTEDLDNSTGLLSHADGPTGKIKLIVRGKTADIQLRVSYESGYVDLQTHDLDMLNCIPNEAITYNRLPIIR